MSLNVRRVSVLAIALLSALAMTASAAFAQYPPASAFGVSCSVDGDTVVCAIVGAEANERLAVTATCDDEVVYNETLTADAEGEADFSFTAANADDCTVAVLGESSGAATTTVDVDDDEEVVAGAPISGTGSLPMTGGQVGVLLLVALTLLGGGLLALRRREDSKVAAEA